MDWISIEDSKPKQGEQVLVFGVLNTELGGLRDSKTVGVVHWDNEDMSSCSDYCYYSLDYTQITHWCKIELPK